MVKKSTKDKISQKYGELSEITCFFVVVAIFIILFIVMFWNEGINAIYSHIEGFIVFLITLFFVLGVCYIRYIKNGD